MTKMLVAKKISEMICCESACDVCLVCVLFSSSGNEFVVLEPLVKTVVPKDIYIYIHNALVHSFWIFKSWISNIVLCRDAHRLHCPSAGTSIQSQYHSIHVIMICTESNRDWKKCIRKQYMEYKAKVKRRIDENFC